MGMVYGMYGGENENAVDWRGIAYTAGCRMRWKS